MRASQILMAGAAAIGLLGAGYVGVTSFSGSASAADGAASTARVDNFRLASADLESYELYRMADAKAVVILTQANGCQSAAASAATLKALKETYAGKGVEFLVLNSSLKDSREAILAEQQKLGIAAPVLMDSHQLVGEHLGVTRAGEVFVIDPKTWRVAYKGALDADTGAQVLDAMIDGKPVKVAAKASAGCAVDFPMRAKAKDFAKISYAKDIAPIIEEKCVSCHQAGAIGPMHFTNYQNVKGFAPMIRETIRTQRMPPYQADPNVGHFSGDKRLSGDQIKTLVHWIEAGAPRGEGPDPLAMTRHVAPEWPLGKPDLVLDIPAYDIPATGVVDYQRPWVKNPLTEGRWLRASTMKVTARQAVHHILTGYLTDIPTGPTANESKWGSSMGSYAVGAESTLSPNNVGVYLPAGGAIGFQNHYTPFGKPVTDKSQIALYFYDKDKTPDLVMHNSVIADPSITIAPGAERHKEVAYITFPKDALLYAAFPHAHYRGNSAQLEIQYPSGERKLLLSLPKYDFNWQRDYDFKDPIKVPAGAKLIATYTYDNSKRNPANPDPTRVVPWGDQSFDEMLYTQIRYRWVDETSKKPVDYDIALNQSRVIGMLDDNIDGKVQLTELKGTVGAQMKPMFAMLDKNKDSMLDTAELEAMANMGRRGGARAER